MVVEYGGFVTLKGDSEQLYSGVPIIEVQRVTCIR